MTAPHVTVRMYQGLLGDCFLLRLFGTLDERGRSRQADANILIDCGVIQRAPNERDLITRVAKSIAADCAKLDLVVATHEHYDHLCGFGTARDIFLAADGIAIDQLWLAWTEDPEDEQANRLRGMQSEARMAIAAGLQHIAARAPVASDGLTQPEWALRGEAMGLDGFTGPFAASASGGMTSGDILLALKGKAGAIAYLEPGEVRKLPFARGLRAFVLGPPRDPTRLLKDLPSNDPKRRETYFGARSDEAKAVLRCFAAGATRPGASDADAGPRPFSRPYNRLPDTIVLDEKLAKPPADSDAAWARSVWDITRKYLATSEDCRIDDDWQNPVGNLALKLDSDTNNTSLVLAFELEPGGDVLLFAADAQVGNWLSWGDQDYPKAAPKEEQVTAEDLLRRTVVYKVGHHGSHNATLSKQGLEAIKGKNLVAFLPLVETVAKKRRWPMPYDKLLARLTELTGGRILRGDAMLDPAIVASIRGFGKDVREADPDDTGLGPLWVEYDVS